MKKLFLGLLLLLGLAPLSTPAQADATCGGNIPGQIVGGTAPNCYYAIVDSSGQLKITGSLSIAGTTSNASSGVATSATNNPNVSYNYGFNGTTWDQLQVDASKFLKVNCASGCAGGTFNNNADAVATSATNGQSAAWLYGFNGLTFDRLQVDASKFLKVNCAAGCGSGTFNNNADAVATSATNAQGASWLYGFNGTTWDRLQVDASKNLKVNVVSATGVAQASATAGQTLSPTGCRTLTAAPIDTTATTNMPWCRTNGTQAFDLASVNGTAVSLGSAVSASSIPVVIASDQAAINVKQATGTNLHAVLDTTSTTAVTQATGTNLHAVLDATSTTAVTGSTSNALDAVATGAVSVPGVAYEYGFNGTTWDRLQVDASKFLKVNCATGCAGGTASNAVDAVATSTTNGQSVVWLYGFNGLTFDRLQVDASKFLKVNCATGCAGGTFNNNADAIATSATNGQTAAWLYGFNGTTFDRLQVDASKFLKVNCATGCAGGTFNNNADAVVTSATNGQSAAWLYGFNGTTWDRLQADASKNLKVLVNGPIAAGTNVIGHVIVDATSTTAVTGSTSNASDAVATGAVSVPSVAYNYGFNGTTWDRLQVDASKNLKVVGTGVAQASTTSGQTLAPIGGRTLATLPTDTTATTNMPVLNTSGALTVSQAPAWSATTTLQSAAIANGNGTNMTTTGNGSVILTVNCATCSGGTTINFEGTEDTTNYSSVLATQLGTSTVATSTAASGVTVWQISGAGLTNIRARISAYLAGTVTVTGRTVPVPATSSVVNANLVAGTAVIGHVITDSGSTTAVTQATGTNLHAVLDTTSTTAVTQATGTNLHAVLDTTSTTAVTQATGSNLHAVLDAGTALIGKTGIDQTTVGTTNAVSLAQVGATTISTGTGAQGAGTPRVTVATDTATVAGSASIPAGTNLMGKVGIDQTTLGSTNGVSLVSAATGGATTFTLTAAATTNSTNIKASAGTVSHISVYNNSATLAWVSFYNSAVAPTCGTGIVWQTMIPANSTSGAGAVESISVGLNFSSGIGICVTTGIAGTGVVAASAYVINVGYK